MEERNKLDNHEWYQPNAPVQSADEQLDIFEDAGLYRVKSREELYEKNKPKRSKGVMIAVLVIALLIGAIALTAILFSEDDSSGNSANDFYDAYKDYYEQYDSSEITGENDIPRADTAPDVELELHDTAGLTALTLQELYAKCQPSIVGISTYVDGEAYSWGSGVIMTADGYIITNTHVLDGADEVEVIGYDGKTYDALLVGADAISDIGVLKIEAKNLAAAQFVDSALVQVGDDAIAIGNPLGEQFSGTMTTGIISGISREMTYNNRTMSLLQTNAALNSGNSGGALFNIYGQVVGITNMKMMGSFTSVIEGVGFAIPSATVKEMADAILDDGAVVGRPGLGIMVYAMGGATEEYPDGMMVNSVYKGSDAEKQGLTAGDIIVEIDGMAAVDIEVIRGVLNEKNVGDTVNLKVWREGETIEIKVKLIDQNDF
ncbi:MAG: trypsin-like peptidase domain-containing protein [Oscillospiraceae bacterium]|nr:trypsin-like peptidase domain-containing protein [Oscillospiraceae bacterium]